MKEGCELEVNLLKKYDFTLVTNGGSGPSGGLHLIPCEVFA